jgi:hypothetical protein
MRHLARLAAFPGLVVLAGVAHADAEEWRLGVAGSGVMTTTSAGGVEASGIGVGGRVRVGYGLADPIEAAVFAGYARTQAIEFQDAMADGQHGRLFADHDAITLGVELRWILGVELSRLFDRTRPYLAIRGGLNGKRMSGQILYNDRNETLLEPENEVSIVPFLGGSAGVDHRFGDHLFVGLAFDVAYGKDCQFLGGSVELAWSWY